MARSDSKSHSEAAELLPWYVNKTLAADEREKVEAHLASCSECRTEAASLGGLESAVIRSNEELPRPSADLTARVMARVDAYERERARMKGVSLWDRLAGLGFTTPRLAMAQLAAIILLAGGLALSAQRASHYESLSSQERQRADLNQVLLDQNKSAYETLAARCPGAQTDAVRINVTFQSAASERSVRELLLSMKASIVRGPSALGAYALYIVEVPVPAGADREAVAEQAVKQMRAKPTVVAFAEAAL